jgi:uncharacterized protein DUF6152
MKRHQLILAAAISMGAGASSAFAHHSHPYFYDQCKTVTIEGRVERVEWKDPHTWVFVKIDDGSSYTVDWSPLSRLTRNGIIGPAKEALVVGARVMVAGNPIRTTAEIREHFPEFTSVKNPKTVDPRTIRRTDNSWTWALPQNPNEKLPDCKGK